MHFVGYLPVDGDSQIPNFFNFYVLFYMLTALHIKVIIQLKASKSRPIFISDIHKNNNERPDGLFGSKHNTLTYLKRFLVSSWSKIHSAGKN